MDILIIIIVITVLFYISKSFMRFEVSVQSSELIDYESLEIEAKLIIALMAKVAKADGVVSELEAELLSNTFSDFANTFNNPKKMREELKDVYKNEKDLDDNVVFLAKELYKITKNLYKKRLKILEYLLNMAFIDKEFTKTEEDIVIIIAETLDVTQEDFIRHLEAFKKTYADFEQRSYDNLNEAYKILGVNKDDDLNTIKKKYRALVKENHPDIITGMGLGESEIQKATIKLQEINAAYELIKKR